MRRFRVRGGAMLLRDAPTRGRLSARLGKSDGNGLLAALYLLAGATTAQRACLHFVQRSPDFAATFLAVLACHGIAPRDCCGVLRVPRP